MLRYDLHCHSTHSDGLLKPAELAQRAARRGVDVLALTDHDELSGLAEARNAAEEAGIRFVNGAELSVSWHDVTLHVVGTEASIRRSRTSSRVSRLFAKGDRAAHGASPSRWRQRASPAPTPAR